MHSQQNPSLQPQTFRSLLLRCEGGALFGYAHLTGVVALVGLVSIGQFGTSVETVIVGPSNSDDPNHGSDGRSYLTSTSAAGSADYVDLGREGQGASGLVFGASARGTATRVREEASRDATGNGSTGDGSSGGGASGGGATGDVTDGWARTAASRHAAAIAAANVPEAYDEYDLNRDGNVDPEEVELYNEHAELEAQGENPGPEIEYGGDEWIPQGQGYDEERDELLTTLNDYNPGGKNVRLTVQDRLTGTVARDVHLGSYTDSEGNEVTQPNKGGGVATDGEFIYVADTQGVYVYRREDVDAAGEGETVPAVNYIETDANASFVTVNDGQLYIGTFAKEWDSQPYLTRYSLDGNGGIEGDPERTEAPRYAQGVAVTDEGLFYTTSFSNWFWSPHSLLYQPFEDKDAFELGEAREVAKLPYFAEELNVIGDDLYITYESGSEVFEGSEGLRSIQRLSLDELELDSEPSLRDKFISKLQNFTRSGIWLGKRAWDKAKDGFEKAKEFGGKLKDGIGDGIGKVKGLFS